MKMAMATRSVCEAQGKSENYKAGSLLLSTSAVSEKIKKKTVNAKHPHTRRRAEILISHPEVRELFGNDPRTALWTVVLVIFQLASAATLTSYAPWWVTLLFMYSIGAVVNHALYVLIHEATHNLVFRSVTMNRFCALIADVPHVFPSAMMFRYYHMLHHIELNRVYKDPDVPYEWEAKFIGNSPLRKSAWLLLFFLVQILRTVFYTYRVPRGTEIAWTALNWITNGGVCAGLVYLAGWRALGYLLLASIFSIGLHPLGARWIAEHYPTQPYQATYSYYGWINRVAFGIGYHVEHHDFPSVPWSRLKEVKALAPEHYNTLFSYSSYSELLWDFIFNRKWSLATRYLVEKEMDEAMSLNADVVTEVEKMK